MKRKDCEPGVLREKSREAVELDLEGLLRHLEVRGIPEGSELMYSGRNRLWIVTLSDGMRVNVKEFKRPGWFRGWIYGHISRPKSEMSFRNAGRLLSMGFDTPEPLGHIEVMGRGGILERSYYICRQADGLEEIRYWEKRQDRDALVDALGREMVRLWDAGVVPGDFSPGNILLKEGGGYRFTYVDVNRMGFGVRNRRRKMGMFKRINIIRAETYRLGRAVGRALEARAPLERGAGNWEPRIRNREQGTGDSDFSRRMGRKAVGVLVRFLWRKDTLREALGLKRKHRRVVTVWRHENL